MQRPGERGPRAVSTPAAAHSFVGRDEELAIARAWLAADLPDTAAIHRFDPTTETFHTFELPSDPGNVRQILGRPGEVRAPESAADQLVVIRRVT